MRKHLNWLLLAILAVSVGQSCKKDDTSSEPKLIFKIKLDSSQQRLDNLGNPASIPAGHAAQSPRFNRISAHYLELSPNNLTQVGQGAVLYHAAETSTGGATAIDFAQAKLVSNGEVFLEMPLKNLPAGSYEYLRLSLSYQNYEIDMRYDSVHNINGVNYPIVANIPTTIASFVGYNNYIGSVQLKNQSLAVNANKLQGFWAAEGSLSYMGQTFNFLQSGQSPSGATTVVNPIQSSSPIPAGSCLATGRFAQPLQISGQETADKTIIMSLSINQSFEWEDDNRNGLWDANKGEKVVDMGLRGLLPSVE